MSQPSLTQTPLPNDPAKSIQNAPDPVIRDALNLGFPYFDDRLGRRRFPATRSMLADDVLHELVTRGPGIGHFLWREIQAIKVLIEHDWQDRTGMLGREHEVLIL